MAGVVNAGLEATMGADILNELTPAALTPETVETLRTLNVQGLVNVETPFLDLTPMTDDTLYTQFIEAVLSDPNVDCLFVGIVPHVDTLKTVEDNYLDADAIGPLLVDVFRKTNKPVVVSVNAGRHYQELVRYLEENGLPVFSDIRSAIAQPRRIRSLLERDGGKITNTTRQCHSEHLYSVRCPGLSGFECLADILCTPESFLRVIADAWLRNQSVLLSFFN